MSRFSPTSGEVFKFRETTGIGINEALPLLVKKNMLDALERSQPNMQMMHDILIDLLKLELRGVDFPEDE